MSTKVRVTFNNCVPVEKLSQIPYLQNYVGNGFVQSNDPVWTNAPIHQADSLIVEEVPAKEDARTLAEKRRDERKAKATGKRR